MYGMSSLPARIKKIQFKMKGLECSQDFSHYKPIGIFPEAQRQLIPLSMVGSGRFRTRPQLYGCPHYLQK